MTNSSRSKTSAQNISLDQLKQLMKNPQIAQFLKEQLELQDKEKSQQQLGLSMKNSESNMNSDTSIEISKYQKEWAKQFHSQVNP